MATFEAERITTKIIVYYITGAICKSLVLQVWVQSVQDKSPRPAVTILALTSLKNPAFPTKVESNLLRVSMLPRDMSIEGIARGNHLTAVCTGNADVSYVVPLYMARHIGPPVGL